MPLSDTSPQASEVYHYRRLAECDAFRTPERRRCSLYRFRLFTAPTPYYPHADDEEINFRSRGDPVRRGAGPQSVPATTPLFFLLVARSNLPKFYAI